MEVVAIPALETWRQKFKVKLLRMPQVAQDQVSGQALKLGHLKFSLKILKQKIDI